MSNVLVIGYIGEGKTDKRFLGNIIKRTFEDLAFECTGQIDVYDPEYIEVPKDAFALQTVEAAKAIHWAHVLCVHTDADNDTDDDAFTHRINPAIELVNSCTDSICKNIVPVVPIHMTEAWMLADIDLLKEEIGTQKQSIELGLPARQNQIERIARPKDVISNAIGVALSSSRRRKISIGELYSPISQKIDLQLLSNLPSYQKFKDAARESLRALNYL